MSRSNPTILLKVPENIIRRANDRGLFTALQFYYQLKVFKIDGYFKDINSIQLNLSKPAVYKNVNKLLKLGWLIQKRDGYYLIKYDKLFKYFGYDLTLNYNSKRKTIRGGVFKIFKIPSDKIKHFLIYVSKEEIKLNFARQKYKIRQKLSLIQKMHIGKNIKDKINSDITLSARGISRLLGFNSSSMGYKIEKLLEKFNLIEIEVRRDFNFRYKTSKISLLSL